MNAASDNNPPSDGQHIASISHDGRFWDVYLEFADDPRRNEGWRGVLAFSPADLGDGEETLRTIPVIIEPSYEEAVRTARALNDHQFASFLRSLLP